MPRSAARCRKLLPPGRSKSGAMAVSPLLSISPTRGGEQTVRAAKRSQLCQFLRWPRKITAGFDTAREGKRRATL